MSSETKPGKLKKLSHKEDHFCLLYVSNGLNGSQAATDAGWSAKTAAVTASKLLIKPNIQVRIKDLAKEILNKAEVNADTVIKEIARLAFSDVSNIISWNESGASFISNSEDISEDVSRAIETIEVTEDNYEIISNGKEGEEKKEINKAIKKTKVKLHSKTKALEMLGRYLKLFADKTELEVTGPIKVEIIKYGEKKGEE
jgi:phage terminase small subunit